MLLMSRILAWGFWIALFDIVRANLPPFSVIYPSATPTINYFDDVSFEWVSWLDNTEVGVFCGQGSKYLIVQISTATADQSNPTTTSSLRAVGALFTTEGWISSFPATCSVSMVSSSAAVSRQTSGGSFVITSNDGQARREYAATFTSTMSSTSNSVPSTTSAIGLLSTTSSSTSTSVPSSVTSTTNSSSNSSSGSPTTQASIRSPTSTRVASSTGLSTGTKAGIVVGSVLGVAVIGGLVAWLCILRPPGRRMQRLQAAKSTNGHEKPELSGQPIEKSRSRDEFLENELEGTTKHEMLVEPHRVEVEASLYHTPVRQELP